MITPKVTHIRLDRERLGAACHVNAIQLLHCLRSTVLVHNQKEKQQAGGNIEGGTEIWFSSYHNNKPRIKPSLLTSHLPLGRLGHECDDSPNVKWFLSVLAKVDELHLVQKALCFGWKDFQHLDSQVAAMGEISELPPRLQPAKVHRTGREEDKSVY